MRSIELFNGEEIRLHDDNDAAVGELVRDNIVVATGRFATAAARQRWIDAVIERAAKNNPRAMCVNCGD